MNDDHARGHDAESWLLSPAERDNPATALDRVTTAGAAWSRGNTATPLVDGAEYFHRLCSELADVHAGDQVYVAAWVGDPAEELDGSGTSAGAQLCRALRAGARVHALFWQPYVDVRNDFVPENRQFVELLRDLGGAAVLDQRVRAVGSHHQKYVVIRRPQRPDRDVAFVGGVDPCPTRRDDHAHRGDPRAQSSIAQVYGPRPSWHDAHLQIRGPAVAEVEHCFRERWEDSANLRRAPYSWRRRKSDATRGPVPPMPEALPPPGRCGPHTVQLLRTYPKKTPHYPFAPRGERSVAHAYVKALRNARRFVYVEDQFLWAPVVAEVFAEALRREPDLRMVAVVPSRPDKDSAFQVATSDVAHRKALELLRAAGGDRLDVYELENAEGDPIYVHSKVCVVDDVWATVGSANLNRRSWTYDSELTAAVVEQPGSSSTSGFAGALRRRLWREHLGRAENEDEDLADAVAGSAVLRRAAAELDEWHAAGRPHPRPPGHLRAHPHPTTPARTKVWAVPAGRLLTDPDGRPRGMRGKRRW